MNIIFTITRTKQENIIFETFYVQPQSPFCFDNRRQLFYKLWKLRNENAIHNYGYKLINIIDGNNITYIYEYNKDLQIPQLIESHTFTYNPFLGKKICKHCGNSKLGYCIPKGKPISKTLHYKCLYWIEKIQDERKILKNVFKQN